MYTLFFKKKLPGEMFKSACLKVKLEHSKENRNNTPAVY